MIIHTNQVNVVFDKMNVLSMMVHYVHGQMRQTINSIGLHRRDQLSQQIQDQVEIIVCRSIQIKLALIYQHYISL